VLTLQPYPAYKDSGVPWLGDVPEHWGVLLGRACYREKKVPNTGLKETTVLSLSYGQIVVKPEGKLHGLVPASFETYQIVEPGDIIIRSTDLKMIGIAFDSVSVTIAESSHRLTCTSVSSLMGSRGTILVLATIAGIRGVEDQMFSPFCFPQKHCS
jgi:hypothetical protein